MTEKMLNVLIAEDEREILELIPKFLQRMPQATYSIKPHVASNGIEAMRMINDEHLKPDLLITDVIMPQMNGEELVRKIKTMFPDIAVIIMSGYTGDADVQGLIKEFNAIFLQKPFTRDSLTGTVDKALASRPPAPERHDPHWLGSGVPGLAGGMGVAISMMETELRHRSPSSPGLPPNVTIRDASQLSALPTEPAAALGSPAQSSTTAKCCPGFPPMEPDALTVHEAARVEGLEGYVSPVSSREPDAADDESSTGESEEVIDIPTVDIEEEFSPEGTADTPGQAPIVAAPSHPEEIAQMTSFMDRMRSSKERIAQRVGALYRKWCGTAVSTEEVALTIEGILRETDPVVANLKGTLVLAAIREETLREWGSLVVDSDWNVVLTTTPVDLSFQPTLMVVPFNQRQNPAQDEMVFTMIQKFRNKDRSTPIVVVNPPLKYDARLFERIINLRIIILNGEPECVQSFLRAWPTLRQR